MAEHQAVLAKIDTQNVIYPIYSLYINQDTSE